MKKSRVATRAREEARILVNPSDVDISCSMLKGHMEEHKYCLNTNPLGADLLSLIGRVETGVPKPHLKSSSPNVALEGAGKLAGNFLHLDS